MIKNNHWQLVPGTKNALIYPFFTKPSITGSNSYILKISSNIVIIDPGGNPRQTEEISRVVGKSWQSAPAPSTFF